MADIQVTPAAEQDTVYRPLVQVDTLTWYYFFTADSSGIFQYVKTTNGGQSWSYSSPVQISAGTDYVHAASVWYGKWTPGSSDTKIYLNFVHVTGTVPVVTQYYEFRAFDTVGETFGDSVLVNTATNALGFPALGSTGITLAKGGTLYIVAPGDLLADEEMWKSTDGGDSWTLIASGGLGSNAAMVPGNEADTNDFYVFKHGPNNGDDIVIATYDASGDSWSETVVYTLGAGEDYSELAQAAVRLSDGHVFGVYLLTLSGGSTYDIRVVEITNGTTYTDRTDVVNAETFIISPKVIVDNTTDDLYVIYDGVHSAQDAVIYKKSTDDGATWGSATRLDSNAYNEGFPSAVLGITASGGRIYAVWFNTDDFIWYSDYSLSVEIPIEPDLALGLSPKLRQILWAHQIETELRSFTFRVAMEPVAYGAGGDVEGIMGVLDALELIQGTVPLSKLQFGELAPIGSGLKVRMLPYESQRAIGDTRDVTDTPKDVRGWVEITLEERFPA